MIYPWIPKLRFTRHFSSAVASVGLILLFSSSTTRSSVPQPTEALPLHLDRHFPGLVSLEPAPVDARPGRVGAESRARYLLALPYGAEIRAAARSHSLDSLLIASVVEAESSFRADAVSPKGALGLMQLMPLHFEEGQEPFDPEVNLMLGARYLAELEQRFDGDLELALAAYHAGPGAVERWGGIPPYRETHRYVGRVLSLYRRHQASLATRDHGVAVARLGAAPGAQRGS